MTILWISFFLIATDDDYRSNFGYTEKGLEIIYRYLEQEVGITFDQNQNGGRVFVPFTRGSYFYNDFNMDKICDELGIYAIP